MIYLQYLRKVTDKVALPLTQEVFDSLIQSSDVENTVNKARDFLAAGNIDEYRKEKSKLPAIMWCGYDACGKGARRADALTHTGLFMIDIDHMKEEPADVFNERIAPRLQELGVVFAHKTPSGKGLRIVALPQPLRGGESVNGLKACMDSFVEKTGLAECGDYDTAVKDFSRLSFVVPAKDWLFITPFENINPTIILDNVDNDESENADKEQPVSTNPPSGGHGGAESYLYKGHKVTEIVQKYLLAFGEPEDGERHAYYNRMCKDFRCILNNNPEAIATCLPLFDATYEHRLSQAKSICRTNTTSYIPRDFYFFLVDNGYYPKKDKLNKTEQDQLLSEDDGTPIVDTSKIPTLPPVFREFCACAPKDFVYPTITALMPVMGTLTSYLRSKYADGTEQSTTFFNVIYAPAGSGKSFVFRVMDPLFSTLNLRDEIADLREQIYINAKAAKSANDKDPKDPHTKKRIMEAINSQPEFLTKMRDNKGYHMFTFAEEVDTFNKGSRGGGIDKSDMFRIAWDNGLYGQSYKSANTFKGKVRLYYNILLTGTPNQVLKYYSNVENGMVTRVSFCAIENQRFAKRPQWKELNQKQRKVIMDFVDRCDFNTYREPLNYKVEDAMEVDDKDYDTEVPWDYNYKSFQYVDLSYIIPMLDKWNEKQRKLASMGDDDARDTFRRRTALKGFRLALICHACWKKVGKKEQKIISDFVQWWMDKDLDNSLVLFGQKYNEEQRASVMTKKKVYPSILEELDNTFDSSSVLAKAKQQGIRTTTRMIIRRWVKDKLVKKIDADKWEKIK